MNRERGRLRVVVVAAIVTVSEYGPPAHVPIYINPYPQVPEDSSSKEDRGPAPPVDGYQNLILGDREPAQQQRDQPPARGPAPPKNAHPQQSRLDEIARQVQKLLQDDQGNVDLNKVPKPVNKPGSKAPGFSPKRRNTMREAENIVKRSGYEAVPKTRTNDGLTIHSSGYNFDGEDLPPTETGSPSYPADEPDHGYGGEETTVAETTIAPVTLPAHIRTIVANFAKQMEKQAKKTRAEASGQATTPKEFSFDGSADRTTPATPSDGYDTVTQGYEEPTEEKPRNGGGAQGAYGGYSASHGAPSPTSIQDKASGEQEEEEYPKRRGARFVPFHQVRHLFI
ncbi:unnamed protein product, partial [Mesorhabditis spiculigera]